MFKPSRLLLLASATATLSLIGTGCGKDAGNTQPTTSPSATSGISPVSGSSRRSGRTGAPNGSLAPEVPPGEPESIEGLTKDIHKDTQAVKDLVQGVTSKAKSSAAKMEAFMKKLEAQPSLSEALKPLLENFGQEVEKLSESIGKFVDSFSKSPERLAADDEAKIWALYDPIKAMQKKIIDLPVFKDGAHQELLGELKAVFDDTERFLNLSITLLRRTKELLSKQQKLEKLTAGN